MICAIYYFFVGIFLIWQYCGSVGMVTRVEIPRLNENMFFMVASGVACKYAILIGVLAVAIGVFQFISHRKSSENTDKLLKSDWVLAVMFSVFAVITIL